MVTIWWLSNYCYQIGIPLYVLCCNLPFYLPYQYIANIFSCPYTFFYNFHRGLICDYSSALLRKLPVTILCSLQTAPPPTHLHLPNMPLVHSGTPVHSPLHPGISGKLMAFPLGSFTGSGSFPLLPRPYLHLSQYLLLPPLSVSLSKSLCTLYTPLAILKMAQPQTRVTV